MDEKTIEVIHLSRKIFEKYVEKRIDVDWITAPVQYDRLMILKQFLLDSDGYILDCGCGEIEPLIIGNRDYMVATDIAKVGLRNLKAKGFKGHLVLSSCDSLPFQENSFYTAVCSEVIEHLPNEDKIEKTIKELMRVSRSTLVTTPNNKYGYRWLDPTHRHFLNTKTIKKFLPKNSQISTSNSCATFLPHALLKNRYFRWLEYRMKGKPWHRLPHLNLSWLAKLSKFKRKFVEGAFVVAIIKKTNANR